MAVTSRDTSHYGDWPLILHGKPLENEFPRGRRNGVLKSSVVSADVRQVTSAGAAGVATGDMPRPDTNGGSQERTRRLQESQPS